jgi:hypothetical protein
MLLPRPAVSTDPSGNLRRLGWFPYGDAGDVGLQGQMEWLGGIASSQLTPTKRRANRVS